MTFALYAVAALRGRVITWPLAIFVGSAAASFLPAHIAIALLMLAGVVAVVAVRVARSVLTSTRDAHVSRGSSRIVAVASIVALATVIWASSPATPSEAVLDSRS